MPLAYHSCLLNVDEKIKYSRKTNKIYDIRFRTRWYSFSQIKFVAHQTQLWDAHLGIFYSCFISAMVKLTVKNGAVTKNFYVIKSCYEELLLKALEKAVQLILLVITLKTGKTLTDLFEL